MSSVLCLGLDLRLCIVLTRIQLLVLGPGLNPGLNQGQVKNENENDNGNEYEYEYEYEGGGV